MIAFPDAYMCSLYTTSPLDNPGEGGSGGMEMWNGSAWVECDTWTYYEPDNIDFAWGYETPTAGGMWRLTEAFAATVGGNPLMPRTGTFTGYEGMMRADPRKKAPLLRK